MWQSHRSRGSHLVGRTLAIAGLFALLTAGSPPGSAALDRPQAVLSFQLDPAAAEGFWGGVVSPEARARVLDDVHQEVFDHVADYFQFLEWSRAEVPGTAPLVSLEVRIEERNFGLSPTYHVALVGRLPELAATPKRLEDPTTDSVFGPLNHLRPETLDEASLPDAYGTYLIDRLRAYLSDSYLDAQVHGQLLEKVPLPVDAMEFDERVRTFRLPFDPQDLRLAETSALKVQWLQRDGSGGQDQGRATLEVASSYQPDLASARIHTKCWVQAFQVFGVRFERPAEAGVFVLPAEVTQMYTPQPPPMSEFRFTVAKYRGTAFAAATGQPDEGEEPQ